MASEWAEEADRQARAMTRDLIEAGKGKGFRVTYQKREARFMLRAGTVMTYFSAHDYNSPRGMNWLQLRIDVLTRARQKDVLSESKANEQFDTEVVSDSI